MSASSKKKLRKEQAAASMTEKQKAAKKEAKKLKVYTAAFWIVLVLCVCLVAGMALKAPISSLTRKMTTAVVVGDHELSAVELNYFYIDAVNNYCNQYSDYLSYFLDTSVALDKQDYDKETNTTWADFFLENALDSAKNNYALYDAAKAAGHTLTEEEKSSGEELFKSLESAATSYGYSDSDAYLQAMYGQGASESSYREYYDVTALASSYYNAYTEDLKASYTDADLRDFEKDAMYEYNSYTYASFYLNLEKYKQGGTKGEDGQMTYTDEEIAKAEADLKAAAEALAIPENNTVDALNAAIAAMEKAAAGTTEGATETTESTEPTEEATEPTEEAVENTEAATEEATEDTEAATEEATEDTEAATEEATEDTEAATEEAAEDTEADTAEDTESADATKEVTEDTEATDESTETTSETTEEETVTYSTCTENDDVRYTSVNAAVQEWIRDEARKEGDIAALPYTTTDAEGNESLKGYYVVIFQSVNNNTYALKNVRHILVGYEGGTTDDNGQTTYSDEEKADAKTKAEEILKEWEAGDKTEDSFAALATEKTTDTGSKENGGLYEDIYPGQMVTPFEDWCFDEARQVGDTGIVQTDYGYHVMYFSGDSDTNYRDHLVSEAYLSKQIEDWQTSLNDAMTLTEKNTSYVKRDLVLNTSGSSSDTEDHEGHDH